MFNLLGLHKPLPYGHTGTGQQVIAGTPGIGKSLFGFYILYCIFHAESGNFLHIKSLVYAQVKQSSRRSWAFERDSVSLVWKPMTCSSLVKVPTLFIYDSSDPSSSISVSIDECENILITSPRVGHCDFWEGPIF